MYKVHAFRSLNASGDWRGGTSGLKQTDPRRSQCSKGWERNKVLSDRTRQKCLAVAWGQVCNRPGPQAETRKTRKNQLSVLGRAKGCAKALGSERVWLVLERSDRGLLC